MSATLRIAGAAYRETESHRHECEVRAVAKMPAAKREKFFDGVERKRGRVAAYRLRQAVFDLERGK